MIYSIRVIKKIEKFVNVEAHTEKEAIERLQNPDTRELYTICNVPDREKETTVYKPVKWYKLIIKNETDPDGGVLMTKQEIIEALEQHRKYNVPMLAEIKTFNDSIYYACESGFDIEIIKVKYKGV